MKKRVWKKVLAPKAWRPERVGEELVGFYGGQTIRNGQYGEYSLAIIHTDKGSFLVSGTSVIQLLDSAALEKGAPVRIVWRGMQDIGHDLSTGEVRQMKGFDVYVAPAEPAQSQAQLDAMLAAAAQAFDN